MSGTTKGQSLFVHMWCLAFFWMFHVKHFKKSTITTKGQMAVAICPFGVLITLDGNKPYLFHI